MSSFAEQLAIVHPQEGSKHRDAERVDYFFYAPHVGKIIDNGEISLHAGEQYIPHKDFVDDIYKLFENIEITTEHPLTGVIEEDQREACLNIARKTRRDVGRVFNIDGKVFCIYSGISRADRPIVKAEINGKMKFAKSPLFNSYVVRIR